MIPSTEHQHIWLQDTSLYAAVETLRSSAIPLLLLHTPYMPEIAAGRFPLSADSKDFLDAVEQKTQLKSASLLDTLPHIDHPGDMAYAPDNLHPSAMARRLYAQAAADILMSRYPLIFSRVGTAQ